MQKSKFMPLFYLSLTPQSLDLFPCLSPFFFLALELFCTAWTPGPLSLCWLSVLHPVFNLDLHPPRDLASSLLSLCFSLLLLSVWIVLSSSELVWSVFFPPLYGRKQVIWLRSYLVGDTLSCSGVLLDPSSSLFHNLHFVIIICKCILWFSAVILFCKQHQLHGCQSYGKDPPSDALPGVSSV